MIIRDLVFGLHSCQFYSIAKQDMFPCCESDMALAFNFRLLYWFYQKYF